MPKVSEMMPQSASASSVLREAFAAESEEEQAFLRSLATDFIETLEMCERGLAKKFDGQMFDIEEGNALWALLPAKVRTAITRGRAKPAQACGECGALGTHQRHCSIGGRFA